MELKLEAVQSVLLEEKSIAAATRDFDISSPSVLSKWISSYNNGRQFRATVKGRGNSTMIKGRKTTLEERVEITQFTIANELDYQLAMQRYNVSYPQLYSWVMKYKAFGESGLQVRRGKTKAPQELTEKGRLELRIKELESRNHYLEMEIDYAKKLQEIRKRPPH